MDVFTEDLFHLSFECHGAVAPGTGSGGTVSDGMCRVGSGAGVSEWIGRGVGVLILGMSVGLESQEAKASVIKIRICFMGLKQHDEQLE